MTRKKDTDFVKKLKLAMLESGLNQVSLAKKLGLKPASVSQWFTGKNNPKMETVNKIARATSKPVNYFFDNSTDVKGNNNVVGHNIKVTPDDDLHKDVKLLSVQVELLNAKMKLLEEEIKKMKRTTYLYDAGKEG